MADPDRTPDATLVICRHGNTFGPGDIVTRVGGRTDLALSQSGAHQASALAAHFAQTERHFDRAYSSSLRRTLGTTAPILAAPCHKPTTPDIRPFLREIDYGPDENQPEATVIDRIGHDALRQWDDRAVLPPGWSLDVDALIQSWRDFFEEQAGLRGTALVMTSNGVARFIFPALGLNVADFDIKLRTGAFGVLHCHGVVWTLTDWNVRP